MTTTSRIQRIGIGVFGLAAVLAPFQYAIGNKPGESGGFLAMIVVLTIVAALMTWLFTRWIPRSVERGPEKAARRGIAMSIGGLVTVVAFWTALPFVLGGTGLTLGVLARERGVRGPALAAIVIGALALAGAVGATITDELG